jgi:HK97 family phage prohead protease
MYNFCDIREFKKLASDGLINKSVNIKDLAIKKSLSSDVMIGEGRQINFIITTEDVDRDRDRVMQDGIQLNHFGNNAVVLFEHDHNKPIGKVIALQKTKAGLQATVEFLPADNPQFGTLAEGVFCACRENFLRCTSIGFLPLEFERTTDETRGVGTYDAGVDFTKIDLFELSIVSVPSNPYCLIQSNKMQQPKSIDNSASKTEPNINTNKIHKSRRLRILNNL